MASIPVPRPLKRPRLTGDVCGASNLPFTSKSTGPDIKREPPHTPLPPRRTLITSGVKRFAPIPPNCFRSCPQYQRNRKEWVEQCISEIQTLNLKVEKKFIRDDGLSIDWSSPVPVWSDTLTPGTMDLATAITEAHRMNAQRRRRQSRKESLPGSQHPSASREQPSNGSDDVYDSSPTKRKLPPPPRPSSMRRVIAAPVIPSPPAGSHLTPVKDVSPQPQSSAPPDNEVTIIERPLSTPSSGPSKDILRPSISESETAAEQDILDVTINYLRRYIQTYDTDRASLASAYSRFASFSYRVHEISCCHEMSSAPPRPSPELAKRSRLDIITTLLTLPPLHSLPSPSLAVAKLDYDMSYLGARLGMFVVARVVLPSRTIVHNFVLQRKEADAEEAASAGVWSLVANAHQIIIFEA